MIFVEPADPLSPPCAALLAEAQALQARLYPDNNHSLPTAALAAPHVRFLAAREKASVLGVGAVALMQGYGEIKSMYTAAAGRGRGVASALLRALEDVARDEKLPALMLETGDELDAACRLYERHGFRRCGPFGCYADNGCSVFMRKDLD